MSTTEIATQRLRLIVPSLEEARAGIAAMPEEAQAHLSPKWLSMLESATSADPWIVGFSIVRREDGATVGQCGFKGPPAEDGVAEIAYAVEPDMQGNGYATEAADALTEFAFEDERVQTVCAHTLPEGNASTRVLKKCGFACAGEVIDPEDGPVWRWEKRRDSVP